MVVEVALRNYEDYLLGKKRFALKNPYHISPSSSVEKGSAEEEQRNREIKASKEADAIAIIRYAITDILEWTPQEAKYHLTQPIIEALKLEPVVKHIEFPRDLDPNSDYWWIVYKAFPSEINYNPYKRVLDMYQRILDGEIKYFPKFVFDGAEGLEKLDVLLHHFINRNIDANTVDDLYEVFGDKASAISLLKKGQLYYAYKDRYRTPLDWLHHSLGERGDDFLYHYYQYMEAFRGVTTNKSGRRSKKRV